MPDGKTHERLRVAFFPLIVVESATILVLTGDPVVSYANIAGYHLGRYLGPDQDFTSRTETEELFYSDFGWPSGFLWEKFWWPYGKFMPHRQASHIPVVSTLVRLLLFLGPTQAYLMLSSTLPFVWVYGYRYILASFCLGLIQSDVIHITADVIYSYLKSRRK